MGGGGKYVKKLLCPWKVAFRYRFKVFYNEIDAINLKIVNENVKGQKRLLEKLLIKVAAKRFQIEEKLTRAVEEAEKKGHNTKTNQAIDQESHQ